MPKASCHGVVAVRLCALAAVLAAGCSSGGIKTHPVNGKVQLAGGDVSLLKNSSIEVMQDADPMVRASGSLAEDGSFSLKTLHNGEILAGAPEGTYKARILLADESDEGVPKRPPNVIHRRYLDFASSGLTLTVPASDYSLDVKAK